MPRAGQHLKETSFNLRIDPELKAAFSAATQAEDKPAAQVVRDFMRAYVAQRQRRAFETQAKRQSLSLAKAARDPDGDDAEITRWIEENADTEGWTA